MYQVTVLYNHPTDPAEFDNHYERTHAPLAAKIPGLRRYTYSKPTTGPDGTQPAFYLVAVLDFDDEAAMGAGMSSPEGQAAAADLPNFASGGATLLTGPATLAT